MTRPVDHADRHRATTALAESIALAAGAGSGKTTVLTQRVVGLLASGIPPRRVAAITFTEKAAGEIRARVREELERRLRLESSEPLSAALSHFGELQLSTIHSFCRVLLLSESLAAGWAPDTEIFDGSALSPTLHRAVRAWRPGFEQRHAHAALAIRLTTTRDQIAEAALNLVQYRDLAPVLAAQTYDANQRHSALLDLNKDLDDAFNACTAPDECTLLAKNVSLRDGLARWCAAEPSNGVTRALLSSESGDLRGGRKAHWPNGSEVLKDAVKSVRAWRTTTFGHLHALLIGDLAEHLVPLVDQLNGERAIAQHDDLLFRTRALLAEQPDVRNRLAQRFDALLIDEVQDTDPLQAEIAMLLSRPVDQSGEWDAHPPVPGRLFAVGDPKQSIYRFRRADVETWIRLVNVVRRKGAGLVLKQNFRSVPGIVDWVNHTFQDMPGYQPQVAHRQAGPLPPVVALPVENREDEVDAIARQLWSLRNEGELGRWSDVMVLLPAWTRGDQLQLDLAARGIPASIEGGRGFFSKEEVQLALCTLVAVDEPAEVEDLVAVLRGWFAVSLNDIAVHLDAGGALRHTVPNPPHGPVGRALGVFSRLHRARMRLSWVQVLDQVVEAARVRELYALLPDGRARLANLDKLFHVVRELEATCTTPSEVVHELRKRADADEDSVQSRDEPRHDAVRITSIFKAKGLEAPVVVLAHNQRRSTPISVAVDRERGQVAISVSRDLKPVGWNVLKDAEQAAYAQERQRWMYVATTRARDQLVLPIVAGETSCLTAKWLAPGILNADRGGHGDVLSLAEGVQVRVVQPDALPPCPMVEGSFGERTALVATALNAQPVPDTEGTAWESERRSAIRSAVRRSPRFKSATQVAHTHRVPAGSGTGIGSVAGSVIHDVLDHLDLQLPLVERLERAREWMDLLARDLGLEEDLWEPCWEALSRILHHKVFERIAIAPEVWKEVPFAYTERGTHVHGVIDCCFPVDASRTRWVVVDWKSDLPPPGSPAHKNYERQIALYARAVLATVTPCEHVESLLVGPHPEIGLANPDDLVLDAVEPELRPVLERLVAAGVLMPVVGAEVHGIPVELLWEDARVALVLDSDAESVAELQGLGFHVHHSTTDDVDWPEQSEDALRSALREKE